MKKYFLYILFLLFIISSQKKQEEETNYGDLLSGSWSYCDENGNYTEIHFLKGGVVLFCPEFKPIGFKSFYEVQGDSLFIFNFLEDEKLIAGELEAESKESNNFNLRVKLVKNRDFEYLLKKMNEIETLPDPSQADKSERNKFYVQFFKKRKSKSDCIKEEKEEYRKPDLTEVDTTFEDIKF